MEQMRKTQKMRFIIGLQNNNEEDLIIIKNMGIEG